MVRFDSYTDPTFNDGSVPIISIQYTWFSSGVSCTASTQDWHVSCYSFHSVVCHVTASTQAGMGSHYPQISRPEPRQGCDCCWEKTFFSSGLTFVACAQVRKLCDLVFSPLFEYQRIVKLSKVNGYRKGSRKGSRKIPNCFLYRTPPFLHLLLPKLLCACCHPRQSSSYNLSFHQNLNSPSTSSTYRTRTCTLAE